MLSNMTKLTWALVRTTIHLDEPDLPVHYSIKNPGLQVPDAMIKAIPDFTTIEAKHLFIWFWNIIVGLILSDANKSPTYH